MFKLLFSKALIDRIFLEKHMDTLEGLFSENQVKELGEIIGIHDKKKEKTIDKDQKKSIKKEFYEILCSKIKYYNDIKSPLWRDFFREENNEIGCDVSIALGGVLDGYFHTIIDPCKYGSINFSKVFNYYWGCYFSIVEKVVAYLIKFEENATLKRFVSATGILDYDEILKHIDIFTKLLYQCTISNTYNIQTQNSSYYKYINDAFSGNLSDDIWLRMKDKIELMQCVGVITTNYYKFAEIVSDKVAYVNGELKLFEFSELLEIVDFSEEDMTEDRALKLFFPFIFGQSFVKPIVHESQIKAFSYMREILNAADILIILGYNINEDDNHINAFLHEFVRKGKQIFVVDEVNDERLVHKKLKCNEESIHYCTVEYGDNKRVILSVFKEILNTFK